MLTVKKMIITTVYALAILYILVCVLLYFFQERFIFFPEKLNKDFRFQFNQPFQEMNVVIAEGGTLHGLLFKADNRKGLIFYLHGNAGSINSWGELAKTYIDLNYDVFMLDYPGYGKSDGSISSQEQIFHGVQVAYDELRKNYKEDSIVVIGYSIGTGPASKLAASNQPRLLILQAPYYNLTDVMRSSYPIIPTFLLKYKFSTNEYLKECKMPVVIFHGDKDELISYNSSLKLKKEMKRTDTLITLTGQGHNGITDNPQYLQAINTILH